MSGIGRLGSRTALAVALLALAAAAVVVLTGRHVDRLRAEREAASASADAVAAVADALRTEQSAAALPPAGGGGGTTRATAVAQGVPLSTLTVARDSGRPVLDDVAAKIVVARYAGVTPPQTVQRRRDQVSGFTIAPLDLMPTLKSLRPAHGGIAVSGPNQQIQSIPPTRPGSAASFTAPLGSDLGDGWTVTVWTTPSRTPTAVWLIALVLLIAGLGAAVWVGIRQATSRSCPRSSAN